MDNGIDLLARQRTAILHLHENRCRRRRRCTRKHGFFRYRKMHAGRHKALNLADGTGQLDFLTLLETNILDRAA